ncbi:uncharacterized protein I206_102127 [Kwoniella pini CBS 10737]|uniref:Uncharacterized protein n=1 Tax=Kwoniella pini CBS 10737 TaxID=1296096 RepID=A0A1B9HUR0_9TREE|nr:uncharacterized protein I206_06780 [Kwoniella pini CBS 10737]OCF47006.1 hypothetical protein I206_06780 [Kwoniella pini CBS 10737]
MNKSLLPKLKIEVKSIIKEAAKSGGLIDEGKFTMKLARSIIENKMNLKKGELNGEWKEIIKNLINEALENIEQGNSNDSQIPSKSKYTSPSSSPIVKPILKSEKTKSVSSKKKRNVESVSPDENEKGESSTQHKKKSAKQKSKIVKASQEAEEKEEEEEKVEELRQARMSDSDISSVYDELPSKVKTKKGSKRKSKSVSGLSDVDENEKPTKKKKVPTSKKKKDPNEGLSPDEAKLADLKRIVVACGVRKQWAKEFTDCPTTSSQTRHLQNLLSSLGMKGTPTLGKAKALKEKRELAQELDDVTTFEAARGVSSDTRERRTRGSTSSKNKKRFVDSDESDSEDADEDEPEELDKDESALGAVMDFLGGDSESE